MKTFTEIVIWLIVCGLALFMSIIMLPCLLLNAWRRIWKLRKQAKDARVAAR
jgi:hypothetical protein